MQILLGLGTMAAVAACRVGYGRAIPDLGESFEAPTGPIRPRAQAITPRLADGAKTLAAFGCRP